MLLSLALFIFFFSSYFRQCGPCPLDEMLIPPSTSEAQNDEKALLEQLLSFLSGTDESELAELDRALGIDKIVQVSCFPQVFQSKLAEIPILTDKISSLEWVPGSNHSAF